MDLPKRILICGLGSMGKRRLRLLQSYLLDFDIFGTDIRPDRCRQAEAEFGIRTFTDYKAAYTMANPFVVFVCTAPKPQINILLGKSIFFYFIHD